MTYFMRAGSAYRVSTKEAMQLTDRLPGGTYTIGFDKMAGSFYLDTIDDFEVKGKIYGDPTKQADRILNTFEQRPGSTGVMLSGEKGSGKTMLAKILSVKAREEKEIPTIVINNPWYGEEFNAFMQMIEQPTIVIFDEFEKVYKREEQVALLTLLDGVYTSKKLFVITCNEPARVNTHMLNRPGRIFYRLDYDGLSDEFIREYCADVLKNQDHTDSVCNVAAVFGTFNFDLLKALVEDMNRYDESPHEALKFLNAEPDVEQYGSYDVELFLNGEKIELDDDQEKMFGNPANGHELYVSPKENADTGFQAAPTGLEALLKPKRRRGSTDGWIRFQAEDMRSVDGKAGKFVFENEDGYRLVLVKRKVNTGINYAAL